MKKLVFLFLFWGCGPYAYGQAADPGSAQKDRLASPKILSGSVTQTLPDSVFNDTIKNEKMNKSALRSPGGALLRSLAVPGWGQLYNKKYFKAVVIAGGQGVLLGTAIVEWKRAGDSKKDVDFEGYRIHTNNRNLFLWLYAGATVFSMIDAYVDAHLSQDTGEGVPQIGNIFLVPEAGKKAVWLKLKINL